MRRSTWSVKWRWRCCRRLMRRSVCSRQTIEHFARRIDADLALFDRNLNRVANVGRPIRAPRRGDGSGWHAGAGRSDLDASSCRIERWLFVRPHIPRRHPAFGMVLFLGAICAGGRDHRLSRRARAHPADRATAGRGRYARHWRSLRACQDRRSRRGRAAGGKFQPRCSAHRGTCRRAPPAAGQRVARIAHAAVAHPAAGSSCSSKRDDAKYKEQLQRDIARTRLSDRRNPAGQPA